MLPYSRLGALPAASMTGGFHSLPGVYPHVPISATLITMLASLLEPGGLGRSVAVHSGRLVLHARHRFGPRGSCGRLQ
jgi:hypothetical protein